MKLTKTQTAIVLRSETCKKEFDDRELILRVSKKCLDKDADSNVPKLHISLNTERG